MLCNDSTTLCNPSFTGENNPDGVDFCRDGWEDPIIEFFADSGPAGAKRIESRMVADRGLGVKTKKPLRKAAFSLLAYQDSNLDKQNQNLSYYHYTIGQTIFSNLAHRSTRIRTWLYFRAPFVGIAKVSIFLFLQKKCSKFSHFLAKTPSCQGFHATTTASPPPRSFPAPALPYTHGPRGNRACCQTPSTAGNTGPAAPRSLPAARSP